MILFKFKEISETTPEFTHMGLRKWRWIFQIHTWKEGVSIGFQQEFACERSNFEWRNANHYYEMNITKNFQWGSDHFYYDSPHCSFSLGFIHFCWSGDWCKKCYPDD